jgi:putative transport protein
VDSIVNALRQHPEVALFLTLAIGYAVGRIKLGSVQLGEVTGVLIAGVVIGQIGVAVSPDLSSTFFLLFLFSIGYKTGPQFVNGLRSSGMTQIGLTVFLCVTGLLVSFGLSRVFGFDAGTAAGLVAGALTESATVGTAGDAIRRLGLDAAATQRHTSNVTVAFAVTYFLGVITTMFVLSRVGPWLMRVDLAAACRELETEMGAVEAEPGVMSSYAEFIVRAYAISNDLDGTTVGMLETRFGDNRVFVRRLRRRDDIIEGAVDLVLRGGDRVMLAGRHEVLLAESNPLRRHEVDDRQLLDMPVVSLDVVVTSHDVAGHTLSELGKRASSRGIFLRALVRAGQDLPFTPRTVVERGDVLTFVGAKPDVEREAARAGYVDRPTSMTDMVTVGAAVVLGAIIGIPAVAIGKLQIGLSLSVGVLVGGLFFGWLRSVDRRFGRIPEPALWLFDSVGLAAFIAATGLRAGPDFVRGLQQSGVSLAIAGLLCASIPFVLTILVGRYVVKMHSGLLLGVCAGAGTSAPGLAAVQEAAKSKIPTLGYGVTYAIGNVLLALWGSVMVVLMT